MKLYLFSLCGTFFLSFLAMKYEKESPKRKIFLFLLIFFLILISGFRVDGTVESDEWNYRYMFDGYIGKSFDSIELNLFKEPGFKILIWSLSRIGFSNQSLIFVTAAFTITVFMFFIHQYSNNFSLASFIFVAGGKFFTSMNIMRQYLAIAIILLGFRWIIKKKFIRFLPYVFIASLFHVSAWVMIFYYFFLNIKELKKKIVPVLIIAAIVMVNFSRIMGSLEGTTYGEYQSQYASSGYGVSLIRILFWGIFAGFIFINRNKQSNTERASVQIKNGYYLSTLLLMLAKVYVYITRLDYTSLCNSIMISEIPTVFTKRSEKIVEIAIMGIFFIYGYYQVVVVGGYNNMSNLIFRFI